MTLSGGQLPFLSNLILSSKFCDFGFGLATSEDKSIALAAGKPRFGERPGRRAAASEPGPGQDAPEAQETEQKHVSSHLKALSGPSDQEDPSGVCRRPPHAISADGSTEGTPGVCVEGIEKERENTQKYIFPVTSKEGRNRDLTRVS